MASAPGMGVVSSMRSLPAPRVPARGCARDARSDCRIELDGGVGPRDEVAGPDSAQFTRQHACAVTQLASGAKCAVGVDDGSVDTEEESDGDDAK